MHHIIPTGARARSNRLWFSMSGWQEAPAFGAGTRPQSRNAVVTSISYRISQNAINRENTYGCAVYLWLELRTQKTGILIASSDDFGLCPDSMRRRCAHGHGPARGLAKIGIHFEKAENKNWTSWGWPGPRTTLVPAHVLMAALLNFSFTLMRIRCRSIFYYFRHREHRFLSVWKICNTTGWNFLGTPQHSRIY